jgi:transposase
MTKKTRRKYTAEFKAEAVKLVTDEGYSISQAARNLDINANMLARWKQQLTGESAKSQLPVDEQEELKQLREEVRQLKLEKEILKKATAFFARRPIQ